MVAPAISSAVSLASHGFRQTSHPIDHIARSSQVMLFDTRLGDAPPADSMIRVHASAAGVANAVVWTWEVDLLDPNSMSGKMAVGNRACNSLGNAPRSPKTHWRQAAHLLPPAQQLQVAEGETLNLVFRQETNGRELRFELLPLGVGESACGDDGEACGRLPAATRPHAPKCMGRPPAEPPLMTRPSVGTELAAEEGVMAAEERLPLLWEKQTAFHSLSGRSRIVEAFRGRRARVPAPNPGVTTPPPDPEWKAAMQAATGSGKRAHREPTKSIAQPALYSNFNLPSTSLTSDPHSPHNFALGVSLRSRTVQMRLRHMGFPLEGQLIRSSSARRCSNSPRAQGVMASIAGTPCKRCGSIMPTDADQIWGSLRSSDGNFTTRLGSDACCACTFVSLYVEAFAALAAAHSSLNFVLTHTQERIDIDRALRRRTRHPEVYVRYCTVLFFYCYQQKNIQKSRASTCETMIDDK